MNISPEDHVELFGKSCYNCDTCCVFAQYLTASACPSPEAQYYCTHSKQPLMTRFEALNSSCPNWTIWSEDKS